MSDSPRIGLGYDRHRLVTGRPLRLGGLTLSSEFGLLGHSDADALLHAAIDAVLGAAGLDDLGTLFPDTDPRYAGADSTVTPAAARSESSPLRTDALPRPS